MKQKTGSKSDHMELDSDTAEQIEEKFQQIMKNKRGGYLHRTKLHTSVSRADDLDSVKTEDFMDKFKETIVGPKAKATGGTNGITYRLNRQKDIDEVSIRTEDFENKFKEISGSKSTQKPQLPTFLRKPKESDMDSIKTEDFENKFKEISGSKSTPKPQLPAFLRKPKDTDIDSIKTEDFENKFKQMQKEVSGNRWSPRSAVNVVKANLQMMFQEAKKKEAEVDSIKTEEFEQKFRELANPKPKQTVTVKPSLKITKPKDSVKIGISDKIKKDNAPKKTLPFAKELLKPSKKAESLRSVDYERMHYGTSLKYVAGIPIRSFDQCHVDSDIDTVKSAMIHDKFQNLLDSQAYEESDGTLSESESTVELKYSSQAKSGTETNLADQGVMSAGDEDGESQQANLYDDSDNEEEMQTDYKFDLDPDESHADDEDDEDVRDIQLETARIQREIVQERAHKSSSAPKQKTSSPKFTDRVVGRKHQLKELDDSVQKAKEDRQLWIIEENGTKFVVMRELKAMKEKLRRHQVDIKMAEKQAKENRRKAEDTRTELMLTEFKRDSATKELEKVVEDINRKKKKAKDIDEKIKAMNKESKDLESMGITKEEVIMIVAENEELQTQARNAHTTELERNELVRQLEVTKEELFAEQKKARSKSEALEEEIELAVQKLEHSQIETENLHKQLEILDSKFKQVEQEKNQLVEAKSSELNMLQNQTEKQVQNVKKQTSREVTELKQKIVALNEKVGTMQAEISQKNQMSMHQREQVIQLQQELTREMQIKEQLIEENQHNITTMTRDKDTALTKLKEVAMSDKQKALDELRITLEKEINNALTRSDERLKATISDHQKTVLTKDQEISILRERLKNQEDSMRQLGEKLRAEARENTRSAIDKEKEIWEREKKADIQRRLDSLNEEYEKDLCQKITELETEKAVTTQLRKQIATLTEEVEDQKCQNRLSFQERMTAINKIKQEAFTDKEVTLCRLQEKLEKEKDDELERFQDQIREQEEEITHLNAEVQRLIQKEQETSTFLERQEKTVVQEINEECRKISTILGVTPKTTDLIKSAVGKTSQMAVTTSALANLKACAEELRHYVQELKHEIQTKKQTINKLHQDKDHMEEMSKLRKNAGKDKNAQQLLREKDRELREIQQNMSSWKEGTAEKIAKKFEEELNRELEKRLKEQKQQKRESERTSASQQREIDRLKREVQRLSGSQTSNLITNKKSAGDDSSNVRLLQQLQNRVKQLRSENHALRGRVGGNLAGSVSYSVPDLANTSFMGTFPVSSRESSTNRMGSKLNALERKSELAEERADKNEEMLSSKMAEVSKLRNTLTQQTKELMQLERAYSQLKQHSRSGSPTSRFTVSR